MPPAVKWLLTANIVVFVAQHLRESLMLKWFALWPNLHTEIAFYPDGSPTGVSFMPWQLVTYAFMHSTSSFTHILFNMFGIWMFGQTLERHMGTKLFTIYYFVCILGAAFLHLAYAWSSGSYAPVLGASGAVFGILLAYGVLFPRERIILIFFPVPIEARYFVAFYGLFELLSGLSRANDGIAHFAHLGGMLFGFFLLRYWIRTRRV